MQVLARLLAPLALAGTLAAGACRAAPEPPRPGERPAAGLMTTLPLIWAEAGDMTELLRADGEANWVREELEAGLVVEPLDTLDEAALVGLDRLVLAQPRPLSPAENVALDEWVRGGGRLLLFADPMLTRVSRFPVGDRRRPQDVVLLSPILTHWGLDLLFDEDQAEGEREVEIDGAAIPLDLAGSFRLRPGARCALSGDAVLVRCRIGKGHVVALADAAVLDDPEGGALDARRAALRKLMALGFE